ncbi:putative nonselective cation channel protein [Neofusicoccum parvum UCRNP2]|uniref:Putative nonselective cation channel protein n=1 Tax=Botryosphaeria parva (strain UCR-NP2) TaxID=1287680 RepID=R1GA71_BOTPV|nr:putative nonselective cation channel protein [Neofusicoccum parvum UCRNP2]
MPLHRHFTMPVARPQPQPRTASRLSTALAALRQQEEQEHLLGGDDEEERVGPQAADESERPEEIFATDPHKDLPVYRTIHRIRRLILASIDDPYTPSALKDPRMNALIVRPLVERLYSPKDCSVVYCLLVNRVQFLHEQNYHAHHHQTVNGTRALLCEIVAGKILRRFDEEHPGRPGLLLLSNILVAGFDPFQNAPDDVMEQSGNVFDWLLQERGGYEGKFTALEIAILSESKHFLAGSACQKVVDAVYRGRVVYTPIAFIDIIPDHYKHKPVRLYNPRRAPILNHYRLIVPRTRNWIDICQFLILIFLYAVTMTNRDHTQWTFYELLFAIYAAGWCLDESATILEHGWKVYSQNLWSFLDITFVIIYIAYISLRMHGWRKDNLELGRQALDILSVAAPILLPRLAFNMMPENMLLISLRAMMGNFMLLTLIAVWCFAGFLLAMRWLSFGQVGTDENPDIDTPDPITIAKWMLYIWFGLDATGIQEAPTFHMILGPALMVAFAFLGNTLFLTILVAILSDTFSKVAADANAEIQFRRAVLTFEGVKSDALFAYRPPFNVLALMILVPLKFVVSARWFHKINVTAVRVLNAPILLAVTLYERRHLWKSTKRTLGTVNKRRKFSIWNWSRFSVHGDIQACFETEVPQSVLDDIVQQDEIDEDVAFGNGHGLAGAFRGRESPTVSPQTEVRRRRFSSIIHTDGA